MKCLSVAGVAPLTRLTLHKSVTVGTSSLSVRFADQNLHKHSQTGSVCQVQEAGTRASSGPLGAETASRASATLLVVGVEHRRGLPDNSFNDLSGGRGRDLVEAKDRRVQGLGMGRGGQTLLRRSIVDSIGLVRNHRMLGSNSLVGIKGRMMALMLVHVTRVLVVDNLLWVRVLIGLHVLLMIQGSVERRMMDSRRIGVPVMVAMIVSGWEANWRLSAKVALTTIAVDEGLRNWVSQGGDLMVASVLGVRRGAGVSDRCMRMELFSVVSNTGLTKVGVGGSESRVNRQLRSAVSNTGLTKVGLCGGGRDLAIGLSVVR